MRITCKKMKCLMKWSLEDFNFLKEFLIRLLQNNVYLNVRSCKWTDDKNNLCSNCGLWPETRMHLFFSCPKTNEIINLLEKILRKAGFLKYGNTRFPYFIYSNYKINTIENLPLIHSLKLIYKCKFDEIKPNLVFIDQIWCV